MAAPTTLQMMDNSFSYQIKVERLPDGECNGSPDVFDLSDDMFQICEPPFCVQ